MFGCDTHCAGAREGHLTVDAAGVERYGPLAGCDEALGAIEVRLGWEAS
jgi:hypothetical protein